MKTVATQATAMTVLTKQVADGANGVGRRDDSRRGDASKWIHETAAQWPT